MRSSGAPIPTGKVERGERKQTAADNAADNRLFVDAVLYRYRTGVPWRDLPARFGDWNIVYQRFNR